MNSLSNHESITPQNPVGKDAAAAGAGGLDQRAVAAAVAAGDGARVYIRMLLHVDVQSLGQTSCKLLQKHLRMGLQARARLRATLSTAAAASSSALATPGAALVAAAPANAPASAAAAASATAAQTTCLLRVLICVASLRLRVTA